jgi:4a-hydroxytetrahydrobiopterin dehydratase
MGVFYSLGTQAQPKECRHARLRRPRLAPLPPAEGPEHRLDADAARARLAALPELGAGRGRRRDRAHLSPSRTITAPSPSSTRSPSFAHREDHHPDLGVHYNRVVARYSTHDVGGLSENDFICAAKASALVD